jgi:pimeloyl-ACP methyl ester carboxylesterase
MIRNIPLATLPLAMVAAVGLGACTSSNEPGRKPATLKLTECRVPQIENAVRCGTLEVFENRVTKQGRKIGINVVVLPASARVASPDPVFLFAGGPGQAAGDLAPQAMAILGGLNTRRDIVLIDQRGTGKSNGLPCKMPDDQSPEGLDPAKREAMTRAMYRECRETLEKHADLTQYTTTIAMADIDDVREALGYDRINLWGGSYGTRSSMEYLRRYPEHVRSVVIDGVASPTMALPATFARDAGASYRAMLAACEKSPVCSSNFPAVSADAEALFASLEKQPRKIMLADPLTGISREVGINHETVLTAMFSTLYLPELQAQLPGALTEAKRGNPAPLAALSSLFGDQAEDKNSMGMRLSVVCAEDVPRITEAERASGPAPFGALFSREFTRGCENWPRGPVPADFHTPVVSDKPVLILSGGLDPVTPPPFGEEVRKTLRNSAHFIAPNLGHGVSHRGCGPKIVKKFIEAASVDGLDGACLQAIPRPTFYEPMHEKPKAGSKDASKEEPVAPASKGAKS